MWPALIAAAGSIAGAGLSAGGGILQGQQGAASARAQMAFQERMFRHRYRYTMQDLRKAGLNPILAAEVGGGGAPSGASYQPPNILAEAGESLASAPEKYLGYSAKSLENEILRSTAKTAEEGVYKMHAESAKAASEAKIAETERKLLQRYGDRERASALGNLDQDTAVKRVSERAGNAALVGPEIDAELAREHPNAARLLRAIERIRGSVGPNALPSIPESGKTRTIPVPVPRKGVGRR